MNRFKRYLAAPVVVLAMVAALLTGCANNTPAPESAAGAAELEIVSVTTDTSTSTAASTHVTAVTYKYNGEEQTATAAEGVLTLVVDGAQKDIKEGVTFDVESGYSFTDIAVVNSGEGAPPWEPNATPAKFNFRQALYVTDGAIQANASVTDAIQGGTYTDTSAEGVTVRSDGPFFNGIYIHNSDYSIKDLTMSMTGDGGNDFGGWGAGVMSDGTSKLTIDGAVINTAGVIRTAVWAGDDSELTVKNSVISAYESPDTQEEYDALVPPMMKRVPFALGLEGVVRATNVLGAATAAYEDSIVVSSGWGVLSTDSGRGHDQNNNKYALNIKNVLAGIGTVEMAAEGKEYTATKEVNGVKYGFTANGSGYVAYADSGVWDQFDNVEFYSPDYVQIMASQNSSAFYKNSQLYSDRIMIMTQQNAGGLISIEDSKADVKDTFVQIKSGAANKGYTDVYVSNTEVNVSTENPWGGNLLELVESDDAGNPGVTEFAVNDTGDNATLYTSLGTIEDSNATFANGTYKGNIWNNIYNYTE
ncbi:MAG: hypothetical protein HUJ75_01890, partial [Parasporobacterium sp.]|nr:hypothetical protein [Parasporobacterium sp.]